MTGLMGGKDGPLSAAGNDDIDVGRLFLIHLHQGGIDLLLLEILQSLSPEKIPANVGIDAGAQAQAGCPHRHIRGVAAEGKIKTLAGNFVGGREAQLALLTPVQLAVDIRSLRKSEDIDRAIADREEIKLGGNSLGTGH